MRAVERPIPDPLPVTMALSPEKSFALLFTGLSLFGGEGFPPVSIEFTIGYRI
jgi:hypothetical protein